MIKNKRMVPVEVVDNRREPRGCFTRVVDRVQGECSKCGQTITIESDDGIGWECTCGQLYNLAGQELRPRSEWEEDDGGYEDQDDY